MALLVIGVLLVAGNLRAGITTVGPLVPDIQESVGLSALSASVLVSLPLLAFAVVSPFAPTIANWIGIEGALGAALLTLTAGLLLRSTPPDALMWVGTALIGVAIAVLNVVLPALVKRDFPGRVGQVTGTYSAVQAIFAALAAGAAVPIAAASSLGWRLPLGMWAALALIAFAVFLPVMIRPTCTLHARADPSATRENQSRWSPWGNLLAWQVTAYMGLQSALFYVFITWLPSIEVSAGIDQATAGVHQFLLNGLAILGSLFASVMISRLADQRVLGVIIPLLLLVSTAGVLFAPQISAIWSSVFGFGIGASIVLALSFFGLRTRDHHQAGALSGMAQGVGYLLAAAGPVFAGWLFDVTGSWTPILIALIVCEVFLLGFGYLAGRDRLVR